ncbi:DUF6794 domain-containing protein [Mesonia oceanica]|uniref:Uncharacterized protein n=1 Tax=Mesonia oceanica TaxID=2687242 RepID=A0AC61Y629_9FLAO|nr:DUF6794 domain-containing protein [Mesonia oceanica]MAQ41381.1 hypothetical protein [Mesonia sp.]VVU99332.1 hypothetical protein FVB9532_00584 [Mesonia oceanica]
MNIRYLSILLLSFSLLSCNGQERIPKELKFSFEYLDKNWDAKEIETFKNISENDSTTPRNYHFGIGMHLRNNLLRHNEQSENLTKFFDSIGIHHYDDMSSIILTSYHRYLNNQDIGLQAQVDKFVEYWRPIIDCEKNQKIKAVEIYNSFKVGDSINIKMPVSENNSVVDYPCGNGTLKWEFNESKDLSISGIITDIYNINNETNVFFKVKILSKNHSETEIMMREVNVGDEFDFGLSTAWKIE